MLFAALNEQNLKPAKQAGGGSAANSMVAFAALGGRAYYHCVLVVMIWVILFG